MNYHNITHDDMNNGDGLRAVLWLSGCSHHCKNCQNPQTWNPNSGILFDDTAKNELFEELSKPYISGITFTGGDPLFAENLKGVYDLIREIRVKFKDKTIWLYTGYEYDMQMPIITYDYDWLDIDYVCRVTRQEIMKMCDVVVDGEYIDEQRDITLKWRGSKNQRVIDVGKSLLENTVTLWCD